MSNDSAITLQNVDFRYNAERALNDITLEVKRGEFLGIIGPNGGGKTTLLKIILGVLPPTKGSVTLFGQDMREFRDWWRIGYVPQRAGLQQLHFPVAVGEIVGMGLVGKKHTGKKQKSSYAIKEALEAVGMAAEQHTLMNELSGGQQQRVFIARALVSRPEMLILDEPTAGVDVEAQIAFYELLRKLNKEMGLTLILVSHDIDVVANEVTTIACLNNALICHTSPKEFLKKDYLEKVYGKGLKFVVHGHGHAHDRGH